MKKPILTSLIIGGLILAIIMAILFLKAPQETSQVSLPSEQDTLWAYPGASVVHSEITGQDSFALELISIDSVPTVAAWYANALTRQDWKFDSSSFDPNSLEVQTIWAAKNGQSLVVSVIRNPDNKTKVTFSQWRQIIDNEEEY